MSPKRVTVLCCSNAGRHLDRLGQLGEFEQDSNTDSEQESTTDSHGARTLVCVGAVAAGRGRELG